jgi:toxin HigB-1
MSARGGNLSTIVLVLKKASKVLLKTPPQVQQKFALWQIKLETDGLRETRKISGFHDEPLKGTRFGERSVRLNSFWRAIYVERKGGSMEIIEVIEVTPHAY